MPIDGVRSHNFAAWVVHTRNQIQADRPCPDDESHARGSLGRGWDFNAPLLALLPNAGRVEIQGDRGFVFAHGWGSRIISSERIRFVVATEAYGPWWTKNRRPGDVVSVLLIRTGGEPNRR